jgi:FkbM family methyltransferase
MVNRARDFVKLKMARPVKLLVRGTLKGVLFDFLRYKLFGSYKIERSGERYTRVKLCGSNISYDIPSVPEKLKHQYLYSIDPLTELSLKKEFVSRKVFVDIGAFAGKYSFHVASKYPSTKVLAIEPNPFSFALLKRNIALNKLAKRITPVNAAIGNKGTCLIEMDGDTSHLVNRRSSKTAKVCSETLLSVLKENGVSPADVDLIKIDVEGSEQTIMDEICRNSKLFSNCRIVLEQVEHKPKMMLEIKNAGFKVERLDEYNFLLYKK